MKLAGVFVQGEDGNTYTVGLDTLAKLLAEQTITVTQTFKVRETPDSIIETTACYFGMVGQALLSKSRHKTAITARAIAMWFTKERLKLSLPEIGKAFGGRDHTSVMHALRRLEARRKAGDEQVVLALTYLPGLFNHMFQEKR